MVEILFLCFSALCGLVMVACGILLARLDPRGQRDLLLPTALGLLMLLLSISALVEHCNI